MIRKLERLVGYLGLRVGFWELDLTRNGTGIQWGGGEGRGRGWVVDSEGPREAGLCTWQGQVGFQGSG